MCEESELRWHELGVILNSWLTDCKSQGTVATVYWAHSFSNIPEMERSSTIHTLLVHRCIWKSSLDDVIKQFEKSVLYGIIPVTHDIFWDMVPCMRWFRYSVYEIFKSRSTFNVLTGCLDGQRWPFRACRHLPQARAPPIAMNVNQNVVADHWRYPKVLLAVIWWCRG